MVGLAQPMPKKVTRSQLDRQLDRARNRATRSSSTTRPRSFGAFWSIWDKGAWRDLAHGSSSTGYAKEEGRSHLEDQLDRPLDQPVEFLNSTGQASTRSSWGSQSQTRKMLLPP
ncbi:unnamed protein product [Microthlaspi erraticum]|uniref:Uncharacterized protein n=1 Tax=Microthlaspi erraticum TaxID=1685480 RepID=A0A6D2IDW1_9BRAS|nr:unnamed protein product [Microthlaspi erraticum]